MAVRGLASRAEVVLDPRLAEVWQLVWARDRGAIEEPGGVSEEVLAGLLRLAYIQGYADATCEAVAGELFRELGIRDPAIPKPGACPRAAGRRRRSSGS